jgi:hypothetical protein
MTKSPKAPHLDCNCVECQPLVGPTVRGTILEETQKHDWAEWSEMIQRGLLNDRVRRKFYMPYDNR